MFRLLVVLCCATSGCISYSSGLGYRARDAAIRRDFEAFTELMKEAVEDGPDFPGDKPIQTVLTHFLDFAGDDRFLAAFDDWRKSGYISDDKLCSVYRARYRAIGDKNPAESEQLADKCIERAKLAAEDAERQWEVEACLSEAPFLIATSTVALRPFLDLAKNSDTPGAFRRVLLDAMTHVFLQDPKTRTTNDKTIATSTATTAAKDQLARAKARFLGIIEELADSVDVPLLADGTAFGALELERASLALNESFLAGLSLSGRPIDTDLAWAWVRAQKAKDSEGRLSGLGLWDRDREPKDDAFWYVCTKALPSGALGAITVRTAGRGDAEALRMKLCLDPKSKDAMPFIDGPYPLERTARTAAAVAHAPSLGGPVPKLEHLARKISDR